MKIGQYCQRQRCISTSNWSNFWQAFASRGFVSDSWAFLFQELRAAMQNLSNSDHNKIHKDSVGLSLFLCLKQWSSSILARITNTGINYYSNTLHNIKCFGIICDYVFAIQYTHFTWSASSHLHQPLDLQVFVCLNSEMPLCCRFSCFFVS